MGQNAACSFRVLSDPFHRSMKLRSRLGALLLFLALIVGVKLGQQLYRWYAHAEEREHLAQLQEEVLDAGAEVVRTELQAETLHRAIKVADQELEAKLREVERFGRYAHDGALPPHLFSAYRRELEVYNQRVRMRNEEMEEYRQVIDRNRSAVDRYNLLSDSIRALGARIGNPYIAVPLPAEAAAVRGMDAASR